MTPTEMILRYFEYKHLPTHLQDVSKKFCDLAHDLDKFETNGPETTTALRKLLESKDCMVRAALNEKRQ
jgi:hypothetical protein